MSKALEKELWSLFDQRRGESSETRTDEWLSKWLSGAEGTEAKRERLEVLSESVSRSALGSVSDSLPAVHVALFMARLGAAFPPNRVMDPCCGSGLLLSYFLDQCGDGVEAKAVDLDARAAEVARGVLGDRAEVVCADALSALAEETEYDLILSEPPLGLQLSRSGLGVVPESCRTLDEALLQAGAKRITENGHVILLVSPHTLGKRGRRFWDQLRGVNLFPQAFFFVQAGALKSTQIASYIVLAGREDPEKVFTAPFLPDLKQQETQLKNLTRQRDGNALQQGRWVPWVDYAGHQALEAALILENLAPRKGLKPVNVEDVTTGLQLYSGNNLKGHESSHDLYLRLEINPEAFRTLPELPSNRRILGVDIKPDRVHPDYLVELLNGDTGKLIFQSMAVASALNLYIPVERFRTGTLYLPDLETQRRLLDALKRIRILQAEARSIEEAMLDSCRDIGAKIERIEKLNQNENPEAWYETLPFPLGSILWRYRIAQDDRERYEHLLHFFEALAEFMSMVHLSAAHRDKDFWLEHIRGLQEKMQGEGFKVSKATFGMWKLVQEYLSSKASKLYHENSEGKERVQNMYATLNDQILKMLFASGIRSAIQLGNSFRNDTYHSGVLSGPDRKRRLELLEQELQKLREFFRETWSRYRLIIPGQNSYRECMFHYENARLVKGTRAPFATCSFKVEQPLEEGRLYLMDQDRLEGLLLLPLIRFGSPPADAPPEACYFYNRLEGNQVRMVSYHHDSQSEVTGEDLKLMEVLSQFSMGEVE